MAIEDLLSFLPGELASKVEFLIILIQALGGLLIIYTALLIIRFFMLRKQNKMINEMKKDIKFIKNKLNK